MMNLAEHFRYRRKGPTASKTVKPVAAATTDTTISPQDFYHEMTARPDVRRILTRLAQVEDGRA